MANSIRVLPVDAVVHAGTAAAVHIRPENRRMMVLAGRYRPMKD